MTKKGKGIETLLELRRGEFITWMFIEDIDSLIETGKPAW